jgi:prepilin-type N-terminal cleavage/methylation domain-containing protein
MSVPRADAEMDVKGNAKRGRRRAKFCRGFTLIELLVVITIIAILMALLFPAFKGVQDQAKRTQAKNDLMQIVTAVNAAYTEYGQYPCGAQSGADSSDYFAGDDTTNADLFIVLRGIASEGALLALNPKQIAFLQIPTAKNLSHPDARSGICEQGHYHDPWGNVYRVKLDNNYNNLLENPYTSSTGAGFEVLNVSAIAWSIGKDADGAKTGDKGNGGAKNTGASDDDVISWQ